MLKTKYMKNASGGDRLTASPHLIFLAAPQGGVILTRRGGSNYTVPLVELALDA